MSVFSSISRLLSPQRKKVCSLPFHRSFFILSYIDALSAPYAFHQLPSSIPKSWTVLEHFHTLLHENNQKISDENYIFKVFQTYFIPVKSPIYLLAGFSNILQKTSVTNSWIINIRKVAIKIISPRKCNTIKVFLDTVLIGLFWGNKIFLRNFF